MRQQVEKTLGQNLRRLRELKGVSQEKMGKIAGVSQKTVSNLENQQSIVSPKLSTLISVAEYFHIHPGILVMTDLTDDSLTNKEVSEMLEKFTQLAPPHQRRIMDLIGDYWAMEVKGPHPTE